MHARDEKMGTGPFLSRRGREPSQRSSASAPAALASAIGNANFARLARRAISADDELVFPEERITASPPSDAITFPQETITASPPHGPIEMPEMTVQTPPGPIEMPEMTVPTSPGE